MDKMLKKMMNEMRKEIGNVNCDVFGVISGALLYEAVCFIKKIGVLEEFLEDKDDVSRMYINAVLEIKK